MRFANTMSGVAVVGDAGGIADFSGQAASRHRPRRAVDENGYARHGVGVSVLGFRDGLPLILYNGFE